jgi:hypothetical protein
MLLLVERNLTTVSRLGERLAQQAGYQVIVASDVVTASRVPALLQTEYHTGGCALASAQWHRPLTASPGDEKPPGFYTHSYLAQIPLGSFTPY